MAQQQLPPSLPKKAYSTPVLHVYGGVATLTKNLGARGSLDGGGGAAAGPKTQT